jgi:hypothetical protein
MIEPAVIEIRGGHVRRDALQALRLLGGGQQLRGALIGKSVHADAAVAGGVLAQPRDGLGAVAAFVAKWIEVALEPPRPRTS